MVRRIVTWTAGAVLALSVGGLLACAFRGYWPLTPARSPLDVSLESGCLWISNVRQAVAPDGTAGTVVIGMDDPHWWWPGETGFVETSWLNEDEYPSAPGGRLVWGAVLPLWVPAAASGALLVGFWRARVRQRRRAMVGRCPRCAYDLTGITGPCPECGKALRARASTTAER